jgi:hypothetical protein
MEDIRKKIIRSSESLSFKQKHQILTVIADAGLTDSTGKSNATDTFIDLRKLPEPVLKEILRITNEQTMY